MRTEAAGTGFYISPVSKKKHPRLQIITVQELLAGKAIDYPPYSHRVDVTFKKAQRPTAGQLPLASETPAAYDTESN